MMVISGACTKKEGNLWGLLPGLYVYSHLLSYWLCFTFITYSFPKVSGDNSINAPSANLHNGRFKGVLSRSNKENIKKDYKCTQKASLMGKQQIGFALSGLIFWNIIFNVILCISKMHKYIQCYTHDWLKLTINS